MADAMTDHFSLAHFVHALDGFHPPTEEFNPTGQWTNAYSIIECSQGMRPVGALRIVRTPRGRDECTLRITYSKRAVDGSLYCESEMICAMDALATPKRWKMETLSLNAEGQPIEDTRFTESGIVGKTGLRVQSGDRTRDFEIATPFAFTWGLFEAVQRRSVDDVPLTFTLVDRLNYQLKPRHTLTYRKSAEVEIGGQRVWHEEKQELAVGTLYRPVPVREGAIATKMHAFEQIGEGIVPIVYWVTEQGRLLFVLAGLIGYIFTADVQI
ncbi:MAG: hypothetical protein ACUVX8_03170 [Candidatus Zipacnadales bacterium]